MATCMGIGQKISRLSFYTYITGAPSKPQKWPVPELWAQKSWEALYPCDLQADQAVNLKTKNVGHLFFWNKNHRH